MDLNSLKFTKVTARSQIFEQKKQAMYFARLQCVLLGYMFYNRLNKNLKK